MDDDRLRLDTSALIAYLRGKEPGASAVERAVKGFVCYVTAITVYELLLGMARARKRVSEEALRDVMLTAPFDDAAARRAAQLHAGLISRNEDIGVKDTLIAAICLERSLPLFTLNERHFKRVPGLKIVTPEMLPQRS